MSTATRTRPEPPMTPKPKYPHTMTRPTDRTLHIERSFDASQDRVWRAMTEPKLLAQWWGRGNKLTVEKYEFVKGGQWRFVEHSKGAEHGFSGEFREITPKDRVSMTFGWDGMEGHFILQTIDLAPTADGKTRMVCTSVYETAKDLDVMVGYGMEAGMAESYAALDKLLITL